MIEGFRLSPQRKHLWSLQQAGQAPPYRIQFAVLIEGSLDINLFEAALQGVFAQHEILHTTISCPPGTTIPVQVISESSTVSIDKQDLRSRNPHEQAVALESLFQAAGELPFDDDKNPFAYISLATLSANKHMLFVGLSALCADAATLAIFVRDLSHFYSACLRGETPAAPALQYADVAQWQNELVESADPGPGTAFWRRQNVFSI